MKRLKSKPARKESQRRKKYVHSNKGRTDETRRPPKTGFPSEVGFRPWTTSRKTQNLDLKGFMVSKIENLWWIGDQIWGTIFEKIRGAGLQDKGFLAMWRWGLCQNKLGGLRDYFWENSGRPTSKNGFGQNRRF